MSRERWHCLTVSTNKSYKESFSRNCTSASASADCADSVAFARSAALTCAAAPCSSIARRTSPYVRRPTPGDLCLEIPGGAGGVDARQRRVEIDGRKQPRPRLRDQRQRLAIVGLVLLQGLVGDGDLGLEKGEFAIAEQLPPFAFGEIVARRGDLPALDFLVLRRNDRRRTHIIRANHKAARQRRRGADRREAAPTLKTRNHVPAMRAGA